MLSDREKLILHFVSMITIAKMTGVPKHEVVIGRMIEQVRVNRCRSLSEEDVVELLDEVNEEMLAGKILFQHSIDDITWKMTGERPNKNTNWRDMR